MAATIEQVTELARQIDSLRTDFTTLSASHNTLHQEFAALTASHNALQQEAHQLRAQVSNMRTDLKHGNSGNLIDRKTMLPEKLSGPNSGKVQFRDWNQGVKAYVRGIHPGVRTLLDQLESRATPVDEDWRLAVDPELLPGDKVDDVDAQLFGLLWAVTDHEARILVKSAPEESGFEAWRMLCRHCDPDTITRSMADIGVIMNPGVSRNLTELASKIVKWEQLIVTYLSRTGDSLSERQKKYVLLNMMPPEWKKEFTVQAMQCDSYGKLRMAIMDLCQEKAKVPTGMDIDHIRETDENDKCEEEEVQYVNENGEVETFLLQRKGGRTYYAGKNKKGKSFGKGMGKNGKGPAYFKTGKECYRCGRSGHIRAECIAKKHVDGGPPREFSKRDTNNLEEEMDMANDIERDLGSVDFDVMALEDDPEEEMDMADDTEKDLGNVEFDVMALDDALPPGIHLQKDPLSEHDPWMASSTSQNSLNQFPNQPGNVSLNLKNIWGRSVDLNPDMTSLELSASSAPTPPTSTYPRPPKPVGPRQCNGQCECGGGWRCRNRCARPEGHDGPHCCSSHMRRESELSCLHECNECVKIGIFKNVRQEGKVEQLIRHMNQTRNEKAQSEDSDKENLKENAPRNVEELIRHMNQTRIEKAQPEQNDKKDLEEDAPEAQPEGNDEEDLEEDAPEAQPEENDKKDLEEDGPQAPPEQSDKENLRKDAPEEERPAIYNKKPVTWRNWREPRRMPRRTSRRWTRTWGSMRRQSTGRSTRKTLPASGPLSVPRVGDQEKNEQLEWIIPVLMFIMMLVMSNQLRHESEQKNEDAESDVEIFSVTNEEKHRIEEKDKIIITTDSGAGESVIPPEWAPTFPTKESNGSRKGQQFVSANGSRIANMGEKRIKVKTKENVRCGLTFQVAKVKKALASVARICDQGNRVVYEAGGGYIENKTTGKRINLERRNNVYVLEATLEQAKAGFNRQGR